MAQQKLKYLGKDGYPYIMNVPARDLSALDLAQLAAAQFNTLGGASTVEEVTAALLASGYYAQGEQYICPDCGKAYKTWDGYNNHVMAAHVAALETRDTLTDDAPLTEDESS